MKGCLSIKGCNGGDVFGDSDFRDGNFDFFNNFRHIDDADAYLAQELNSLSVKERERVYDDIHGVGKAKKEDPEVIEQQLEALENELKKIKSKPAYERALFLSPRYVKDRAFRLMFLRGDEFIAEKAAARMVTYFNNKRMLFGEEKLVKKLTLDDLTPDDLEELETGAFQQLPEKDRCGRPICHITLRLAGEKSWRHKIRSIWYSLVCVLEDEDAQKNGIVNIYYCVGDSATNPQTFEVLQHARILDDSLPYRSNATHFCYDSAALRPALTLLQLVSGKDDRVRFRTHFGSHMECRFSLMTFGIPNHILPLDNNGNLKAGLVQAFVAKRRAIEDAQRETIGDRIDYPLKDDVLHGRGRPYQEYAGNAFLSRIFNARRDEYNNASRFDKTVIAYDIVKMIHERGGRFIQRDEATGGWTVVSDSVAREKISSGFRTRTRRQDNDMARIERSNKRTKVDTNIGFY